ncbi:MAG TPA: T9SS type A sorting domain-containing protein, partial [Parafilimonas sp.]|nr:T9SS type A sorting domain-containing protein [Parafilimonas sp.]
TGRKLWVSDGTDAGTTPAPNNNDIVIDADYLGTTFPVLNSVLYIPGSSSSKGNGLFKYDASDAAGLVLVKDLAPGADPEFIVPSEMEVVYNTLYFKVTNYTGGLHDELWNSKGTKLSTQPVKIFLAGETTYSLHAFSGNLYFVKYDIVYGTELWKTDGTDAGTVLASDIFKGVTSSYPACLTNLHGKLLFSATDELKGTELFFTDNAGYTTDVVKDINTVSTSSSYAAYYGGTAVLGDHVFFSAYERVHDFELYRSNGSSHGTDLFDDISPGETGSFPHELLSKNNEVYFITQIFTQSAASTAIYKTNNSKNGLRKITPDFDANQYYISSFKVADNGIVFFGVLNYYTYSYELWRSDGTAEGTFVLSSALYFDFTYYRFADYLNVVGNTALFAAGNSDHGIELWKSDGSLAGTKMVKDINPGSYDALPGGMFAYNNEVYFGALDGTSPYYSFWKSDGTKAGTVKLANIDPWWGFDADETKKYFCVSNNTIFFSAIDHSNEKGTKLWKTNGTAGGTGPIKDLDGANDGGLLPAAYELTDVNGTVFFTATDFVYSKKLWKSDGTAEGTQLIKDITNDPDGVSMTNLTSFGGRLFFANSGSLWSSDGTVEGTIPLDDEGISGVQVLNIAATSDKLFITGYNNKYGVELYAGEIDDETGKFATVRTSNESAKTVSALNAFVYPNPAVSNATLQLAGNMKNVSVTISDMRGNKLWQSSNISAPIISLPTEKFAAGIYLVTVVNGKESKTITLVKQ